MSTILLNTSPLVSAHQGRGVGTYTRGLVAALKKTKTSNLEFQFSDHCHGSADLYHYPFFDLFYHTLPFKKEKPTIVSIHDLTPLVMTSRYPKGVRGTINVLRQWLSLQNIAAIITDSENSKNDINKIFRIPAEKIFVTLLAVNPIFKKEVSTSKIEEIRKKYNLPEKFVFTVSAGANPNKNLPSLAEVTDRIGIPLVIVGKDMLKPVEEPVHPELIDMVRLRAYNHIIIPDNVSVEELNVFYHMATLFVQPSLYEGFGLPLLEAMTAGCLVASSRVSSLPEIYHQEAITFNPSKLKSMELAIRKALKLSPKKRQLQIDLARKRSEDFTWEKTAKKTLEVYKKVLCQ